MINNQSLISLFGEMPDPRLDRKKLHRLDNIIAIAILAVICGAESWVEIEEFGEARCVWLETFLELPNGIPSHDTFNRVFSLVDPEEFEKRFVSQGNHEDRSIEQTLTIAWELLSSLPVSELKKIDEKHIKKYLPKIEEK